MSVSKRLRYEILRRDNHACRYCGGVAPDAVLTVDHVVPTALGGNDDPSNLVAACRDCNAGKSSASADASLVADVDQDAVRWAAAIKRATDIELTRRGETQRIAQGILDAWSDVPVPSYQGGGYLSHYIPADFFSSLAQFKAAGLDPIEIVDAAYIVLERNVHPKGVWRYFCGICWRKIEERHAAARALLEADDD